MPVATASLGQVHRAVLRSGREVAVKVQRPHVREQVAMQDLEALDDLARVLARFTSITKSVDLQRVLKSSGGRCSRNSITQGGAQSHCDWR